MDFFPKDLNEAFSKAPGQRDKRLTTEWYRARAASAQGRETNKGQLFLQLQVMLLDPGRKGMLLGHKLWLTENAWSISKDMLAAYGLPGKPNDVLKVEDFNSLPACWVYIKCKVYDGRMRYAIENVVPMLDTDDDGPTEDRI